jgi:hypothetical protein
MSSCERNTVVKLVEGSSPPTFHLSGDGIMMIIVLFGPYGGEYGKDGNPKPIWEVNTKDGGKIINAYSPFIYGVLPNDLYQRTPKGTGAPVLEEGKEYVLHFAVAGAKAGGACFRMKNGKALSCR